MPQEIRIASIIGDDLYLRCPYQANVMKTLEASSIKIGAM
jgi:hypothetical protein